MKSHFAPFLFVALSNNVAGARATQYQRVVVKVAHTYVDVRCSGYSKQLEILKSVNLKGSGGAIHLLHLFSADFASCLFNFATYVVIRSVATSR